MFRLDTDGTTVLMHRGNTGVLKINLSGYTFGNDDRVLFMMKSQSGTEVKSKICQVVDGAIEIPFINTDTDYLSAGDYIYAITAATDPVYDDGKIVNGTDVYTPTETNNKIIRIIDTAALI